MPPTPCIYPLLMESVKSWWACFICKEVTQFLTEESQYLVFFNCKTAISHISPPGHTLTDPMPPTPWIHPLLMESVKNGKFVHFQQSYTVFLHQNLTMSCIFHRNHDLPYLPSWSLFDWSTVSNPLCLSIIDGISKKQSYYSSYVLLCFSADYN